MRLFLLGFVLLAGFTTPAAAAGVLYDCTVKQKMGPRGWVSPRIALVIDEQGGGKIIDSLSLRFETGPRPAKIRKQGDKLVLTWSFSALQDRTKQNIPQFNFRATLNTKTGAFKVRGKPPRFPQTVTGTGTCAQRNKLSTKQLNRLLKS